MSRNPFMKKLGLSDSDRAAIVHVDDVGMCLSSIESFFELYDFGTVSSAALMAPAPGSRGCGPLRRPPEGTWASRHAESEWRVRWGPVSTRDTASGLMDAEGYSRGAAGGQDKGKTQAAARELGPGRDWSTPPASTHAHRHAQWARWPTKKFMEAI
jgi:hypothetical protein